MKTRVAVIVVLLTMLGVLLARNDERIVTAFIKLVNPIKQKYASLTKTIENESKSYIFQKERIETLTRENKRLHRRLLKQHDRINQLESVYRVLPYLHRYPSHTVSLVQTVSYIKLNRFSQILLTQPKGLEKEKIYGLIQGDNVAGIARIHRGQLQGYLVSDPLCRFAVHIGDSKAPGIAIGLKNRLMEVKFIPKWYDIRPGDEVRTSGLDSIFFKNLPVGKVIAVDTQSAYKVATIRTYADIFHPDLFFLIQDAEADITEGYDRDKSVAVQKEQNLPSEQNTTSSKEREQNETKAPTAIKISDTPIDKTLPSIEQTHANIVDPEPPVESPPANERKRSQTTRRKSPRFLDDTLDLF